MIKFIRFKFQEFFQDIRHHLTGVLEWSPVSIGRLARATARRVLASSGPIPGAGCRRPGHRPGQRRSSSIPFIVCCRRPSPTRCWGLCRGACKGRRSGIDPVPRRTKRWV